MRTNRFLKFIMSILLTVSCPFVSYAGGGSDGGTKWSVHQFVVLAKYLITAPSSISEADRLVLQKGLDLVTSNQDGYVQDPCLAPISRRSGICEDRVLMVPRTGEILSDNFIAYGSSSPPLIQLRAKTSESNSFQNELEQGRSVAQFIFHELYRVSGVVDSTNSSPDHNFQLSINKYHLDQFQFPKNLVSLPSQKMGLSGWDDEKLANYKDRCVRSRLELLKAQLDNQAQLVQNSKIGFTAVVSTEDVQFFKEALSESSGKIIENLNSGLGFVCKMVEVEWVKRTGAP